MPAPVKETPSENTMENLEVKLTKAQAELAQLLSVSWWTLSEDDQEIYADRFKKASDEIEELQRRIAATRDVRVIAKRMKEGFQ